MSDAIENVTAVVAVEVTDKMTAKDRVRAWFQAQGFGDPYLTLLSDHPEPQLQVEYEARAAMWPRSMFETAWRDAEDELVRFFVTAWKRERDAVRAQNGGG